MAGPFSAFTNPAGAARFAAAMLGSGRIVKSASDRGARKAAIFLASEIRKGIVSQAPGGQTFTPLAESTLRAKRPKTKALINKGDLRRSVQATRIKAGWLVGVNRNARSGDGSKLANIAAIMENGTKEQNPWAVAARAVESVLAGGSGRVGVSIPPRPFVEPIVRVNRDKISEMVGEEVFSALFKAI